MQSFFFGTSQQKLYGSIHPASSLDTGVLLCNSWGPEAQASHRVLNTLASRLAAAGISTMRFDYFGTGDSYGSQMEVSLQSLLDNVYSAVAEIRDSWQVHNLCIVGYRLGAIPTIKAASELSLSAVLLDPVLNGQGWFSELEAAAYSPLRHENDFFEAGGYVMSEAFAKELQATNIELENANLAKQGIVFSNSDSSRTLKKQSNLEICEAPPTWLFNEALGLVPIPSTLLDTVVAKVESCVNS